MAVNVLTYDARKLKIKFRNCIFKYYLHTHQSTGTFLTRFPVSLRCIFSVFPLSSYLNYIIDKPLDFYLPTLSSLEWVLNMDLINVSNSEP